MKQQFITQILVTPKRPNMNSETANSVAKHAEKMSFKMFEFNGEVFSTNHYLDLEKKGENTRSALLFNLNQLINYTWVFLVLLLFTGCSSQRWQYAPGTNDKVTKGVIMDVYQTKQGNRSFTWAKVGYLHIYIKPEYLDSSIYKGNIKLFSIKRLGAK